MPCRCLPIRGMPIFFENAGLWQAALSDAEDAGLLVLTVQGASAGSARLVPGLAAFDPAQRDNPAACRMGQPGAFLITPLARKNPNYVGVPCAYRTVAEEYISRQCGYRYDVQGGLSWGIPYCVGVMALGCQVAPALTNEEMLALLVSTAAPTADGARHDRPRKIYRSRRKPIQVKNCRGEHCSPLQSVLPQHNGATNLSTALYICPHKPGAAIPQRHLFALPLNFRQIFPHIFQHSPAVESAHCSQSVNTNCDNPGSRYPLPQCGRPLSQGLACKKPGV